MIHSEDGATPLLSTAQRYLPSHSSSYRTIPSVPLPYRRPRRLFGTRRLFETRIEVFR